jgi:DNA polymerase I-like protein with 3'-5' exonuclease and polymerase domains
MKQAVDGQRAIAFAYPDAWAWKEEIERRVRVDNWLREPFGRKRHFYGGSKDVTEGVDYVPQATGASILHVQIPLHHALAEKNDCYFPLTVHDSFLHEVPLEGVNEYAPKLQELVGMEYPQVRPGFQIPSDVKVGRNWGAMEALDEKAA